LSEVALLALKSLVRKRRSSVAFHSCVVAGVQLGGDHSFKLIRRMDAREAANKCLAPAIWIFPILWMERYGR
jgi:hypothetical protein